MEPQYIKDSFTKTKHGNKFIPVSTDNTDEEDFFNERKSIKINNLSFTDMTILD